MKFFSVNLLYHGHSGLPGSGWCWQRDVVVVVFLAGMVGGTTYCPRGGHAVSHKWRYHASGCGRNWLTDGPLEYPGAGLLPGPGAKGCCQGGPSPFDPHANGAMDGHGLLLPRGALPPPLDPPCSHSSIHSKRVVSSPQSSRSAIMAGLKPLKAGRTWPIRFAGYSDIEVAGPSGSTQKMRFWPVRNDQNSVRK